MTRRNSKCLFAGSAIGLACFVALNLASAQSSRTWNGSVNNDWFNASNWTPVGVPATNDTVNFSSGTINLTAPVTIGGQFNWSGGTLSGSALTIASNGVLNINGGGTASLQSALTNAGTVNWLSGDVVVYNSNAGGLYPVVNLAGGVWNIRCDQRLSAEWNYGNTYFQNTGTVQKSANTGTTWLQIPFYNSGTASAQQGTLNFNDGGTVEGWFSATNGTAILFSGGSFSSTTPAVLSGAGAIQFTGGSLLLVNNVVPSLAMTGGTVSLGSNFQGGTITNLTLGGTTTNLTLPGSSLSGNWTVSGLLNCGGGASGSLLVVGGATMNWFGGTISGPLTIASGGVLWINWGVNLQSALTNAGTVNWLSGDVVVYNSNAGGLYPVVNLAGGVWNIRCDQRLSAEWNYGNTYFQNTGTVQKSANTGTTWLQIPFYNSGTASAQQGTLNFNDGGTVEGWFSATNGTAILFSGGSFSSTTPAVLSGAGAIQFTGGSLLLVNNVVPSLAMTGGTVSLGSNFQGGTITNLTLGGTTTNLTLPGSSLSGNWTVSGLLNCGGGASGSLLVVGGATMNWFGGTISGPLTIASGGVLWINWGVNLQSALTNAGTVNWLSGDVVVYNSNAGGLYPVVNLAGGVWNIRCDQRLSAEWNYGNTYFQNTGTVQKSANTGTTWLQIPFYNSGTASAQQGTLNFNDGGTVEGWFSATNGTAILFSGGSFSSTTPAVLSGAGAIQFTGGSLLLVNNVVPSLAMTGGTVSLGSNFQGGTITNLTLGGTTTNLTLPGSSLSGNWTVSGLLNCGGGASGSLLVVGGATMNWFGGTISGPLTIASGGVLWINWGVNLQSALTNAGTVNWLSGDVVVYNSNAGGLYPVVNLAGGVWNIRCDQRLSAEWNYGNTYFQNTGTVQKSANTGTTWLQIPFYNSGTASAQQGTISFDSGPTLTGGTLNFGLSGPSSFGTISVSGTANLGGTLSASLLGGYIPAPGSSFPVMTYGSCSGAFSSFTLPSTWLGVVNQGATSLTLGTLLMAQQSHGGIAAAPGQTVYTNGQMVTLTAVPYRWYEFVQWNDGSTTNPRLITASLGSGFGATFTNTVPLEQLNIGGATRSAPVGMPVVLLNGQWYSNNVVLATNGASFQAQLQSSFTNATFFYTTDGSDPNGGDIYSGPFNVTAPFSIRAVAYSADFTQDAEADAVNSLNVTNPGGGSVTVSPRTDRYSGAGLADLTATAAAGWAFLNWSGDASGTNTNTSVVVDGPKSVQAVFGMGLTTAGAGLVQRQPDLTLYPYGSTVRLTAIPTNSTTYFRQWGGAANGQVLSPLDFVITNANPLVSAIFFNLPANYHSLTVLINGDGEVTKAPQQSNYLNNASVTLTATPGLGSFFVNWTGDTNSALDPLSVVMNTNKTITANFRSSVGIPPSVTITNPVAGAVFVAPVNIPIAASATTGSVALASVAFYGGTNLLSTVSNAPYACTWTNAPVGTNVLTALALDNSGLSATSAPVSIIVLPPTNPPVFLFSAKDYAVNENAGSVVLTVLNSGDLGGSVSFQTVDGTAQGGTGFSGDYTSASGNLALGGHQATNISIPILDNFLDRPDIQFQVQLLFPSTGALLGSPATATVTIHENDVGGATNSLLTVALPGPQPPMNGQLTVTLAPPEANGQWRFPWDLGWRTNGQTVAGLVPGDYPLEFRSLSNYLAYPPTVTMTVPNNGTVSYTNQYYPTFPPEGTNETCSLTVNIGPNAPPVAGWRFRGETAWRNPGASVAGLLPDTYFVEFAPVSGWSKPASQAVELSSGASMAISVNYLSPASPGNASLPVAVPANSVTDYAHYPYGFNGQLQTDTRFGSGVAVRPNVVLTAAHLVFDDQTLSYVKQAYWSFQQEAGAFQPQPLLARGWYLLSGYAVQRTNDLQSGLYGLDQSSPASRNVDVAALYFAAPAARSGSGGYLTSDAVPNPWLTGSNLKMLVGYPVDGSYFGQVVQPGMMYITPPQADSRPFTQLTNQSYAAPWLLSYPGNSGGPVYVQVPYGGGSYYFPAAVYVGTLYSGGGYQSVVRAIDNRVVNLINLAASTGDTGTNNTGGGVITITAGRGSGLLAYLQVPIRPPGAVAAGAAWRKYGTSRWSGGPTYTATMGAGSSAKLEFKPIAGWNVPTNITVQIALGQLTVVPATYTPAVSPARPVLTFNPATGLGITGTTGETFRLEYRTSLVSGQWLPLKTNTLGPGFNLLLPWPPTNGPSAFYRAVWLP